MLSGMSLADKVVLVTGAARGMGHEYVRGFRKAGARVIATDLAWEPTGASSDHERFLEEVGNSPDVLAEYMDIRMDSHVKRVFTKSVERFGTIDVIVNNAGMRERDLYPPHGSVYDPRDGSRRLAANVRHARRHVAGDQDVRGADAARTVEEASSASARVATWLLIPRAGKCRTRPPRRPSRP
jgi:NAD(P)-dependent dehydrogenase (short-subunit alcohol dehydrogenase family)